jgi:anti-sigma-K factor RskA
VTTVDETSGSENLELVELRSFAPDGRHEVSWETPPEDLWDRIFAAVDEPGPVSAPDPATGSSTPGGGASARDIGTAPGGRDSGAAGRRGTRAPWLLAAAASVAVLAIGGWWLGRGSSPDVLAATPLERLQDVGRGEVELVDDGGSLRLRLDTEGLEAADGFLEVWVIDPEVSQLVSLGPLRQDGVYELPDGLDPEAFPIVDVSVEPFDGDPTHSGNSVLRGQLEF